MLDCGGRYVIKIAKGIMALSLHGENHATEWSDADHNTLQRENSLGLVLVFSVWIYHMVFSRIIHIIG